MQATVWSIGFLIAVAASSATFLAGAGTEQPDTLPQDRAFEIAPGAALVLPIPEGWEAEAGMSGGETTIQVTAPGGQSFTLRVVAIWDKGPNGGPMTPDQFVLFSEGRSPSFEAEGVPGSFEFNGMLPARGDVSWISFQLRETHGARAQYLTYMTAITESEKSVFVDAIIRSDTRDPPSARALRRILSGARTEWALGTASEAVLSREDEERVRLLLARMKLYYKRIGRGRYRAAMELWAEKYSEDGVNIDRNVAEMRRWESAVGRLGRWEIDAIWTAGDRAKVSVTISGRPPGASLESTPISERGTNYWVFESGDWFFVPIQLTDWDDEKAVAVPRDMIEAGNPD